ncbi:Uncharacterised protein [uncultured archaeon]|nr:Uncharacterised protein [uncultured archaeon]
MDKLIENGYIPYDKSWIIRMGFLDLIYGYNDCIDFLKENYESLSDDLKSLHDVSIQWRSNLSLDVGESGTLYRFFKFASWKLKEEREFILRGTLKDRSICDNPEIVNFSLEKLLSLDNNTSQFASASVLMGNSERIINPPYKLQLTYDAIDHWKNSRLLGKKWEVRYDNTIFSQALAYLGFLKTGKIDFVPEQAEDYCFARAFGIMTQFEGEKKWPSLIGHESNRILEMEKCLLQNEVSSKDHRVVQSIALRNKDANFLYPNCVNKSWPQFWAFLEKSSYI